MSHTGYPETNNVTENIQRRYNQYATIGKKYLSGGNFDQRQVFVYYRFVLISSASSEPHHEISGVLQLREQRCRPAVQ